MTKELFRKEAILHRSGALFGDVVLRGPLASWVLTALIVATLGLVIGVAILGRADLNGEAAPLWRWFMGQL